MKRANPDDSASETVVLEPRTSVTSFEGLPWALQKAVAGAINGFLYGDKSEKPSPYYKSPIARKNREKLARLASQVYGYINSTISEHSNIDDYYFRIWPRIEVDRKSGEIVEDPRFEVDLFRYIGRVAAKAIETKTRVNVIFVQADGDRMVSPSFARMLRRAVSGLKEVEPRIYADTRSAPSSLKERMMDARPHLFIGDSRVFALGSELAKTGPRLFLESEGKSEEIRKDEDLARFVVEHSGVKPEIFSNDTVVRPADEEIAKIGKRFSDEATDEPNDVIAALRVDRELDRLLEQVKRLTNGVDAIPSTTVARITSELKDKRNKWMELKSAHEAIVEEMKHLQRDFKGKRVNYDTYSVQRFMNIENRKSIERELVELQTYIKGDLRRKVMSVVDEPKGKGDRS